MDNYGYTYDDSSPGLGTAALVMGICSLVLIITGLSFITGALGILFALLSRGSGPMKSGPKAGLWMSACGLIADAALIGAGIYMIQSGALDRYLEQFQELYDFYYEDEYEDYMDPDYFEDPDQILELFGNQPALVLADTSAASCHWTEQDLQWKLLTL